MEHMPLFTIWLELSVCIQATTFKGYGQSRPIALNKTSEGRKKNERIQVVISKK